MTTSIPESFAFDPARHTLVPNETLRMLGALLHTAFRLHCTGETLGDRNAWELVREARQKLHELAPPVPTAISEEQLTRFLASPPMTPTTTGTTSRQAA
ncbi:MAG: hypothetical protein ACK4RK_09400 [Gemmataceae bacterium]